MTERETAVQAAVDLLSEYAPEKLAYVPLRKRVGQYVRGTRFSDRNGEVGRIVGPDQVSDKTPDNATIEFSDGRRIRIYNLPDTIYWEAVEVEVKSIPASEEWVVIDA